jgi:cell division septum initiation protein DivIVA
VFKRMLQTSPAQGPGRASAEETPATHEGPPINDFARTEISPKNGASKLPTFEEIYRKSTFKSNTTTAEWNILKVADMLSSEHLQGLSLSAKHSALMMAFEASGVAVEDILQDAVQRQRVLNEYEEAQLRRLQEIESIKQRDNERLAAEMESVCAQFRARIQAGMDDIERERQSFREWQELREHEQRRIADAAGACVSGDPALSETSVTRLLEKNAAAAGRYRESA